MAGSYSHCVYGDGKFRGEHHLLDHMGDAYEALEEMHWMISYLAGGDLNKIFEAHRAYVAAPDGCNNPEYAKTMTAEDYWDKDDLEDSQEKDSE